MKKKLILTGLIAAAIVGSWAVLGHHNGHAQTAPAGPPQVTVARVMERPVSDGADFTDFRSQSYGCQFIAAEKRHYGDADKCRRPERAGSAFCPAHHAVVFVAAAESRAVRAP